MCSEEAAAMLPQERPEDVPIGLGNVQRGDFLTGKEAEHTFRMRRRAFAEAGLYLEQKHEPVTLPGVGVLADDGSQVQVGWRNRKIDFLSGFPAGARIRRFAFINMDLAAARTPETEIGFASTFQ